MEKNPEVEVEVEVDLERQLRLIDVSSEDDCLISASYSSDSGNQDDHKYFELSEAGIAQEREGTVNAVMEKGQELMLTESSEPERRRKTAKCNLRKSLAWDSAFFTGAGVLEPEELSIINSGLVKANVHPLPGIEEEVRGSSESNFTLEGDNMTLESLEVGLFEDVRASIQRSNKRSDMAFLCGQAEVRESSMESLQSTKKMKVPSANKMKPMSGPKRQTISKQGLEKPMNKTENTKKEAEKSKREAGGIKKEAAGRPRATQAAARSGDLYTLSVRPPKIAGRVNPVSNSPTKRSVLCGNHVKIESSSVKSSTGRRETMGGLKTPVFRDPILTPRCTPSPRSSSSSSASGSMMDSAASCSSHNRYGSTSSDTTDKSVVNLLKKKTDSRNHNLLSASNLKSPLRSSKTQTEAGDSRLSAYLLSVSKLSPSISPASSIDGWSSESSSSTSVNQNSNSSVKSLDLSSPHKGFYLDRGASQITLQKHQHCVEQRRPGLPGPYSKKTISGAGSLSRAAGTDLSRSSKPSGLRMPSPKIGFFDAEKSTEPTRTARLQLDPVVRSAIPKHRTGVVSHGGETLKAKPKLQPARNMRPPCPAQPQELPNTSPEVSSTKSTKGNYPRITTSKPQYDGGNGAPDAPLIDMDTIREEVSATKGASEDCPSITTKFQNDVSKGTSIETQLKTGEVRESTISKGECLSSFLNEGRNDCGDPFVADVGTATVTEKLCAKPREVRDIATEQNDWCPITSSESHTRTGEEGEELTKIKREGLFLKEGENYAQDTVGTDIDIASEKLLHVRSISDEPQCSLKPSLDRNYDNKTARSHAADKLTHGVGHVQSNDESNEKENSLCLVDFSLSRHMGSMDLNREELTGKKDYSINQTEGKTDSGDTELLLSNSREVHGQEDELHKVLLKAINHPHSPGDMDVLPRKRTPLADKRSLCSGSGSCEFASESAKEKVSTYLSIIDDAQTDNS